MRIISGRHKGIKLTAPTNLPVRPTTDRAKEGIFNILQHRYFFKNKKALDLFSGTGNISYEFASRGCEKVTSVDINSKCVSYISSNAKNLNLNIQSVKSDAIIYLERLEQKFDFIYLDPPYTYDKYDVIKNIIFKRELIIEKGCLVIEHHNTKKFIDKNVEQRKYGTVCFSIFSF